VAGRSGVSPQTFGIAAAVVLLFLLAVGGLVWMQSGRTGQASDTPTSVPVPATTTAPAPPPATTSVEAGPPAGDPPAAANLTTVYIDFRPWARVRIVPSTPNPAIPTDTYFAPFAIDLPPGDYNLEAENGGVTPPTKFELKVGEGAPMTFVRNMPGFNATKIVEGLLGQD
jgi:hypothetical protein